MGVAPGGVTVLELPPRARRILLGPGFGFPRPGTTSACAENTLSAIHITPFTQNYLRVRGEYSSSPWYFVAYLELPPRARRILASAWSMPAMVGTTSACAENTPHPAKWLAEGRNYLRVRGEYRQ